MLHLVPSWQSSDKHEKLHVIMQDRPVLFMSCFDLLTDRITEKKHPQNKDLIQSELSGIAFEALQQAFREEDIEKMFETVPPHPTMYEPISIFVDPGNSPQTLSATFS